MVIPVPGDMGLEERQWLTTVESLRKFYNQACREQHQKDVEWLEAHIRFLPPSFDPNGHITREDWEAFKEMEP